MRILSKVACLVIFVPALLSSPSIAKDSAIDSLLDKARTLRKSGRPADAKPLAEQAVALAEKQKAWQQLFSARQELSFEERLLGNYDRLLQLRLANLETVRKHREAFLPNTSEEERTAVQYVAAAYSWKKDYVRAIQYCREDLAGSEANDRAHGISALVPHALQRLGINLYLAGQYPEAEQRLRDAYAKYVAFFGQTHETQAASYYETQVETLRWLQRVLVAQKRFEEALEAAELGRSRALAATITGRMSSTNAEPAAPSLQNIRTIAKEHGSTLVEYSLLYDYDPDLLFIFSNFEDIPIASIYIWVVDPGGRITFRESPVPNPGPSFVQMVRRARYSVGAFGRGVTVDPEPNAPKTRPLQDLYNLLVAPIAAYLPRESSQLVTFVLQDWLFMLPFSALQDGSGHYLIEQHTIAVAPSLGVLDLTHKELRLAHKGKGALIVGNPAMPSLPAEPGQQPYPLNPLPGTEVEAKAIGAQLHATPLIGAAATKNEVLRRLPNAQLVHFATHGLLDQTTGGQRSALALAPSRSDDGFLTMTQIQDLKLNADLVVLSACDTARGKMSGDGVLGLSRAFLTAGVPSMLISLWAIPDAPTAFLMEHFYQRFGQGQDKATSLRTAMLDTMKSYPSPGNWAAFVLLGESASAAGSVRVTGNAEPLPAKQVLASEFSFPLPNRISNLREDPNPNFEGAVTSITYDTPLTLTELTSYYELELAKQGLKEVSELKQTEATSFSLVFRGPWGDRQVAIGGTDMSNLGVNARSMSLRFALRGDDDAEFSPAANEKRAGISIPPHATGVDINNKFDSSAGVADLKFLSTMTSEALHGFYRPLFLKLGYSEYTLEEDPRDEKKTWEFHGPVKDRALFLHVEKSFFHPERREVSIRFDRPSK